MLAACACALPPPDPPPLTPPPPHADVAKAGETLAAAAHVPPPAASVAFSLAAGALCYLARPPQLDAINSALVLAVVASFAGLLGAAAGGVDPAALARADWGALPRALPVIALAFVYQNVVPVSVSVCVWRGGGRGGAHGARAQGVGVRGVERAAPGR